MNFNRREFLGIAAGAIGASATEAGRSLIDRKSVVARHNPVLTEFESLSPLSVGNGELGFTVDPTGLQTFPEFYEKTMPLCTLSQWGWHSKPANLRRSDLRLTGFSTFGREVGYATDGKDQKPLYDWLRENPHRLHLGRIGLVIKKEDGSEAVIGDIRAIRQELDLWSGVITSQFEVEGHSVRVVTLVHPGVDCIETLVESSLISVGRIAVRLSFPYGSPSMQAADWSSPDRHESRFVLETPVQARINRRLDDDSYVVSVTASDTANISQLDKHTFQVSGQTGRLGVCVQFARPGVATPGPVPGRGIEIAQRHWAEFWTRGGALSLEGSSDPRAEELERRIVLSQYLTAINCSGSLPPQETGLTVNSWYGKFHLEMHWWHAAHFALWNRLPLLERSLGYYRDILPQARDLAKSQGYLGARWPKMTSPDGLDSPSPIGPLLIWQQPHPIFYSELCYRANPVRATLTRYGGIVEETARFMESYAHLDARKGRYVLGPPLIPAQENHPPRETWNPTFELAYWQFGLRTAQKWRIRQGLPRNRKWDQILLQLSPMPIREGVYLAHENCPQTFTERNRDHPSMLGALGVLPGDGVDHDIMKATLRRAIRDWKWDETWGWDYPMTAMTAARLGEPGIAVSALLMQTEKNRYLRNGHNYQRKDLPCYLPGNGGLLYAVALMAAGWQGKSVSGFPQNGKWNVRFEGLSKAL